MMKLRKHVEEKEQLLWMISVETAIKPIFLSTRTYLS